VILFAQPFVKNIIDNNGDQFEYYIMSRFNYFIYQSILSNFNKRKSEKVKMDIFGMSIFQICQYFDEKQGFFGHFRA